MQQKKHKVVQQKPFSFEDWWEKQDLDVEYFKPCRKAWYDALKTVKGKP
jgi:hypothetical protein